MSSEIHLKEHIFLKEHIVEQVMIHFSYCHFFHKKRRMLKKICSETFLLVYFFFFSVESFGESFLALVQVGKVKVLSLTLSLFIFSLFSLKHDP